MDLRDKYDAYTPLYDRFKLYFGYLNTGRNEPDKAEIFAYNGGLFAEDEVLDNLTIDDDLLYKHTSQLSNYDFASEVDVNILGHIFEHSLNEIEEINAELKGEEVDTAKTRRKKDGVFYTPKYITKYIVENTVGKLCEDRKTELDIDDEEYRPNRQTKTKKPLLAKLDNYRNWLLDLTICDPACGSGAFLNQALEFLITEHTYLDELQAKLLGESLVLPDIENQILENNLFGVDINEESVEIAKLSLWLRTAQKGRQLTSLNHNIKCGNSLIDDHDMAGDKAFNWEEEFPSVFENGGFNVVIGNPPYGAELDKKKVYGSQYGFKKKFDSYQLFTVLGHNLIKENGCCGLIIPNSWMTRKAGKEFRSKLFKFDFHYVLDFVEQVFEDANIDTCIIVFSRSKKGKKTGKVHSLKVKEPINILDSLSYNEVEFAHWKQHDKFNCELDDKTFLLFEKIEAGTTKLGELTTITGGYKPYQVGYGKSIEGDFPQTRNDVKKHVYHSDKKIDDTYYPDIKGSNIQRYYISPNTKWVKWGEWLMSPKNYSDFVNPKIVVREVTGYRLNASYDEKGYFTNDTTHMIRDAEKEDLKYYLGIINSTLMGWYFRKYFGESNDLFPKIKVNELKDFPIKETTVSERNSFVKKVDIILSLTEELEDFSTKLSGLLLSKFDIPKLSRKLQSWHELTFKQFLKELKKKKVKLSIKEDAEWMDYFNEQKAQAAELKSQIAQTDAEIDAMVYELYGLSEEEVRVVEGSM